MSNSTQKNDSRYAPAGPYYPLLPDTPYGDPKYNTPREVIIENTLEGWSFNLAQRFDLPGYEELKSQRTAGQKLHLLALNAWGFLTLITNGK